MKKYISYVIIVVLVAVAAAGGTYVVMIGQLDNQNKETENDNKNDGTNNNESSDDLNSDDSGDSSQSKTGVELVSTKTEGSNIIQTFNAYMNGKTVPVEVKYDYYTNKKLPVEYYGESNGTFVQGKMNDTEVYFRDTYNNKNLTKENVLNTVQIEKSFNENNFRVIKGTDNKDYLIVVTHMYEDRDDFDIGRSDVLYIFNDSLKRIETGISADCDFTSGFVIVSRTSGIQVAENPWYKNEFNLDKINVNNDGWDTVRVKVENNQIYSLNPKLNIDDPSTGTLEERVYTINNDKLSYKTINSYKITNAAGGSC